MLICGLLFALSLVPFADASSAILRNVILYQSYSIGVGLQPYVPKVALATVLYAVLLVVPLVFRRRTLIEQLQHSALAYVLFAPGLAPTHFLLLIAMYALTPSLWLALVSIPITAVVLLRPFAGYEVLTPVLNVAWALCAWRFIAHSAPISERAH